ncbi:hypothetical protein VNI00_018202 [Paramarasmius palmivorus]|uniref:Uncharacterized protein n=1 Tax=Paramarasmius palmivorus TaxID=297713 RepID=A0AAW0AYQ8_9AGAR
MDASKSRRLDDLSISRIFQEIERVHPLINNIYQVSASKDKSSLETHFLHAGISVASLHQFHNYKAFPREAMEVLVTLAHLASTVGSSLPGIAALTSYLPNANLIEQWKRKYDIQVLPSGFHLPSGWLLLITSTSGKDVHQDDDFPLLSRPPGDENDELEDDQESSSANQPSTSTKKSISARTTRSASRAFPNQPVTVNAELRKRKAERLPTLPSHHQTVAASRPIKKEKMVAESKHKPADSTVRVRSGPKPVDPVSSVSTKSVTVKRRRSDQVSLSLPNTDESSDDLGQPKKAKTSRDAPTKAEIEDDDDDDKAEPYPAHPVSIDNVDLEVLVEAGKRGVGPLVKIL